jgi:hypothetical protein
MINDVNKKQILDGFIENIACISDRKYQERVWVQAEGPECDDIDDTVCNFFDEDFILEKYRDFGITESQYKLLRILHKRLRTFTDTFGVYSPHKSTEKLIQLPEWTEITEMAKQILKAFNYNKFHK